MPLRLYMDHHIPRTITVGLRLRQIDVLTAFEDDAAMLDDSTLLDRASALRRVLFSQDDDLLREAVRRQREGIAFSGVIYVHQRSMSVGACIADLETVATVAEADELYGQVLFLPF